MSIDKVSQAFNRIVHVQLHDHLEEIIVRNRRMVNPTNCATHDFCDANMLMYEAYDEVMGPFNPLLLSDCAIRNAAWAKSKEEEFSTLWYFAGGNYVQ